MNLPPLPAGEAYEGHYNADDMRAYARAAMAMAFLEAACIFEHEALPSELPRFKVATDVLRDRADELDKEQK